MVTNLSTIHKILLELFDVPAAFQEHNSWASGSQQRAGNVFGLAHFL